MPETIMIEVPKHQIEELWAMLSQYTRNQLKGETVVELQLQPGDSITLSIPEKKRAKSQR